MQEHHDKITSLSRPELEVQLVKICESVVFREANRLSDFLRYIVNESLARRAELIKASSIAIDVFGKSAEFDANSQSLVRVQAGQLRLRLAKYYSDLAADGEILIEIPRGRYAPVFSYVRGATPLGTQIRTLRKTNDSMRASILVLPPKNLSGNPDLDFTCFGFSEEIVTALTKFPELRTLSATSVWEDIPSIDKVSLDDADYALRGSLRLDGDQLRLNFHLISLKDRMQVWSSAYDVDRSIEDLFSIQSSIAQAVVFALTNPDEPLVSIGQHVPGDDHDQKWEAYQAILEAYDYYHRPSQERHDVVKERLLAARDRNSQYSELLSMLAMIYLNDHRFGYATGPTDDGLMKSALSEALKAVNLSPRSGLCWHYLAQVYFEMRDFEKYEAAIETSMSLSMCHPYVLVEHGHHVWMMGDADRGLALVEQAFKLNPRPPGWYYYALVHDDIAQGRFDSALKFFKKLTTPGFFWQNFLAVVIQGHRDDARAAETALNALEQQYPVFADNAEHFVTQAVFPDSFKRNASAGINKAKRLLR